MRGHEESIIDLMNEESRLREGIQELEERTRRNGDMADRAVNTELRRLLRLPVVS